MISQKLGPAIQEGALVEQQCPRIATFYCFGCSRRLQFQDIAAQLVDDKGKQSVCSDEEMISVGISTVKPQAGGLEPYWARTRKKTRLRVYRIGQQLEAGMYTRVGVLVREWWRVNKKLLLCLRGNLVSWHLCVDSEQGVLMTICVPFSFRIPQFVRQDFDDNLCSLSF